MAREFAKSFYKSKKWHDCRDTYIADRIAIDGGMCEECGRRLGEELHHVIFLTPGNIQDPLIALNPDNLLWLCKDCHFRKHKATNPIGKPVQSKAQGRKGYYFDDQGNLVPVKRYIVYGAPGAGKTTYVREHMQAGDLVVGLDNIKRAISLCGKAETPDNLLPVSLRLRDALYRMIETDEVAARTIWIMAALPYRDERQQLCDRLRAELIYIPSTIETCLAHILQDAECADKAHQYKAVEEWFAAYQAPPPLIKRRGPLSGTVGGQLDFSRGEKSRGKG